MSWLVSAKQYIPAVIGEPFGGGYFAGYISHTANGVPTHALIVAPKATGATGTGYTLTTNLQWKTTQTTTANTTSFFDGAANTAAIVAAGIADHPAAQFCVSLSIGGFNDWYLPSLLELEIAYFNLKPTNSSNNVPNAGPNIYAVPRRDNNWTASYPTQTYLTTFNTSQEAFPAAAHWSSQDANSLTTYVLLFNNGQRFIQSKITTLPVRAFRRIAL